MPIQPAESLQPIPLEVTVYGPCNALKATNFGAKRLLLCRKDSSCLGGLTPKIEELESLRDKIHIPISCIVRPCGAPVASPVGDSYGHLYTNSEFIEMCESTLKLKETGVMNPLRGDSFVFGCLRRYDEVLAEGLKEKIVLDRSQCDHLVNIAKPFGCVFNAFDHFTKDGDWSNIISQLIEIGFTGVMIAGGSGKFNRHIKLLGTMGQQLRDIQLIVAGGFRCPEIKKLRAYANECDTNTVWINGDCLRPERHEDLETCDMSSVMGMMDLLGLQTTD